MNNRGVVAALAAVLLGGCGVFSRVDSVETAGKERFAATRQSIERVRAEPAKPIDAAVEYHEKSIVTLKAVRTKRSAMESGGLWCRFKKLATVEPVSIMEFAQIVTRWCGIPVRVTPDAIEAIESGAARGTALGGAPGVAGAPMAAAPGMPVQPGMAGGMANFASTQSLISRTVDITHSGDIDSLLDVVTAKFGLSWKREDGRITIYNFDTQTFHLYAFGSNNDIVAESTAGTTMASGISGSVAGAGGTGAGSMSGQTGATQSAKITIKTSIWDDIKNAVNTIKSPKGTCTTAPSTGTITCTDTGEGLRRVGAYVRSENINLTKQVLFHVKILSVTFKNNDALGVSWSAVYETLKNKYSIKLASSFNAPTGSAQGTFSVLDNSGSRWQGSDAVISALSEFGTVAVEREPSIPTLNLQAAPVQVADVDSFIPGSTTQTTASVGSTTSLQIGSVTTGFAMMLLPYVLPNGGDQMLLHFSLTLSALDDIRKVTVGTAYAEAPIVKLPINSVQKVRLRSGQTLMLTGFDQNTQSTNRRGVGSPGNWMFGGGLSSNGTRSALVVLITPVVDAGDVY